MELTSECRFQKLAWRNTQFVYDWLSFDMGTQNTNYRDVENTQGFLPLKVPPNCFRYSILYEDKRNFFFKAFDHV